MSVYLRLFHGRVTPDEQLNDWGTDGPVFGPYDYVSTTYGCEIRMGNNVENPCELSIIDGLVFYDGIYYGDWTVFDTVAFINDKFTAAEYDEQKARKEK